MTTAVSHAEAMKPLLDGAVLGLFRNAPKGSKTVPSVFLTTLYSSLLINWDDPSVDVAATDGLTLWLNPTEFAKMSPDMRVTVLAHELWHIAFLHMDRLEGRDPETWNEACDHAINLMLKEYGYTFNISHVADPKYAGMSADQIYDDLIKNKIVIKLPMGGDLRSPPGKEEGEPGDQPGGTLAPAQMQEVINNVVRAITLSKMSGDPPGSLPGSLETKVDQLLNPKLPWFMLLRRWFSEIGQPHYTWRTPNRRHIASDMYLPGLLNDDQGLSHIVWACDSSGSVDPRQLQVMNSEICGVQRQFNPERMTLAVFDTVLHTVEDFQRDEAIPPMTFKGRGGTDLDELWEWARKHRPKAMVVFSDLYVKIPPQIPGIPVLWVCLDNPKANPPYGRVVHVNSR